MPIDPIRATIRQVDMSDRIAFSSAVVASPAAAAETIIASVTLAQGIPIVSGVVLVGWAAYTVGANGVTGRLRVRQTDVNGTTKVDTGLLTRTAAQLVDDSVLGFDAAPADGQIYKLTLIVGSGSAASTVSAVGLLAIPI